MNKMTNFAEHIISLANSKSGGISNLQLQKVMYFVLGDYIKDNGINAYLREIYQEPFEAWPYGPVIRTEYFRNKIYGRYNIEEQGSYNEFFEPLDSYVSKYLSKNVNELVEESHKHSTWYNNKEAILSHQPITYTLEDLNNDFRSNY